MTVLRTTSIINGRQFVPFLNVDLRERFSFPMPFSDKWVYTHFRKVFNFTFDFLRDGLLMLNRAQNEEVLYLNSDHFSYGWAESRAKNEDIDWRTTHSIFWPKGQVIIRFMTSCSLKLCLNDDKPTYSETCHELRHSKTTTTGERPGPHNSLIHI